MAVVRPFCALRPVADRIALDAFVCAAGISAEEAKAAVGRDPRSSAQLVQPSTSTPAALRFQLAELLRARILVRDAQPSLTMVRVLAGANGEAERAWLFGALRADSVEMASKTPAANEADAANDADDADRDVGAVADPAADIGDAEVLPVDAAPVVCRYDDKKGRIARAVEAETEREPDASFAHAGRHVDVWIIDDESVTARITSLLEASSLEILSGAHRVAARQERARAHVEQGAETDARAFALACFVDDDQGTDDVLAGLALFPRQGTVTAA